VKKVDYKNVENLIKAVSESSLTEFELQSNEVNIKMKKEKSVDDEAERYVPKEEVKKENIEEEKEAEKKDENLFAVKSPIVGTFYGSSSPGAEPSVKIGSKVKAGDVLCIIEAMKLMNEIQSEVDGEVVDILVKNGQLVEYGEPLILIRK
jgi:acetyl-CoA carboxylase biotin carboxyl carrier protein